MKLLVVDDSSLNRKVALELLANEGAQVCLASGGAEGVVTVLTAQQHFDAVIMDIQMPDVDGYEATRRIRADSRFASLPIVAMTANVSATDQQACLAAGMNAHIGKPIDLEVIVTTLCSLLKTGAKAPVINLNPSPRPI